VAGPGVISSGPILVGIDFSPSSEPTLAWAVDAAIAFDAPLIALHVAHDPAESPGYYQREDDGQQDPIERVAGKMMEEFIAGARLRLPHLAQLRHFGTEVVVGLPVTRILEVAAREGARLIVMGAHGRTALADALLGSKVERVTRLAPIPVTVVRPAEDPGTEAPKR
jgi:nucleotide-binding universal stress UspA family protein